MSCLRSNSVSNFFTVLLASVALHCFSTIKCTTANAESSSSSTLRQTEVSFYGSSHVSTRLQEAKSTSDIYFRLRTRRSDSMLFLVAGRTDYCLLVLDAGRLKVHINLGAGETEIASEAGFLLNDMKWHTVNLTRRGSQMTIQIDDHITKSNLPTRFHELNIHFGVWIGGLNGFNEIFLGNLPSFRGCMSHITYNSEDVLQRAAQYGEISGISWNCSEEFDAKVMDPFSFNSTASYGILRIAIPRQGTIIKMDILTTKLDGLIFYVTGLSSRPDFLALQNKEGKPYFVAELGTGQVHLQSTINISDNQWHSITLQVSSNLLLLVVDNVTWSSDTPTTRGVGSRQLDVSEIVYLGGVEDIRKNKLRSLGLIDQSYVGCMQNLNIDGVSYGLPQVDVSRDIMKGCFNVEDCHKTNVKTTTCKDSTKTGSNKNNINTAVAVNKSNVTTIVKLNGTHGGDVIGAKGSGSSSNVLDVITIPRDVFRVVTQTSLGELEIMRLSPVQVAEGDSVIITPRHLAMTLDLSKFGIRESGVLFRVLKPPQEGRIEVTTRTTGSSSSSSTLLRTETFALLDVGAGRVRYFHNGAESSKDSIELVLRLVQTTGFLLPAYLQDERVFTLQVEITNVNDPPEIRLVPGGVLRLAERTKIRLTPGVITSLDPDTPPEELVFSLMPMGLSGEKRGNLELSSEPGKSIEAFTQADLENKQVWYVDQGSSSSKLAFKVSDGSSISSIAILRIETFSLRIVPEVNSGLEIANTLGTTTFITSNNLSFTSNAMDQGLIIEYHIVKGPKAGVLQLKRVNGQWGSAEQFTQQDLTNKGVRYLLQRPSDIPTEDEFSFHVSLADVKLPTEFRFRLRIVSLRLEQVGTNTVILNETTESLISTRQLQYRTFPVATIDSSIKYLIVKEPIYGILSLRAQSLSISNSSGNSNILSFTQADISSKRIFYHFYLTPYTSLNDNFLFNITTPSTTNGPFECNIQHHTQKEPTSLVTVKPLTVTEGSKEFLTNSVVRSKTSTKDLLRVPFYFNVTSLPSYGIIGMKKTSTRSNASILTFTSIDLEQDMIYYQHDGTESSSDKITLLVWNSQAKFMFEIKVDIIIIGVNNHPPIKDETSSQIVHVVIGQARRLTKSILNYVDEDWDSDPKQLKYTILISSPANTGFVGNIYNKMSSLKRPVFAFSQDDLNNEILAFAHEGTDVHGFINFWVTDSKFTVNGTLEIVAAAPYVHIVNTTTLAAKHGSIQQLTGESIRVDTNMDVDQQSIVIRIVGGPQHGIIRMDGKPIENYTLGNIKNGLVFYENTHTTDDPKDYFQFKAVINAVESTVNELDISIYPEAYWTPLKVAANESVFVNENSSAIILQTNLQVINPHIPSSHVVYTLTKLPRHGYLAVDPKHSQDEADAYVTMWDQTVINEGRLRYVQSEPNQTVDLMSFEVTNGVLALHDLKTMFIVVPTNLLLASVNVEVNEGGSTFLNVTNLYSAQAYFSDKLGDIKIINGPLHGTLQMISEATKPLETFSYNALQDGKIIYNHDGSETLHDQFVVVGQTIDLDTLTNGVIMNEKSAKKFAPNIRISQPFVVQISIVPTNDQVPKVMNNTGTWVWTGSQVLITNKELAAIDNDSDGNILIFYIVDMAGGYPAHSSLPSLPLLNFTQDMINSSEVIFVHKGENTSSASFEFEVSDGLNEANKESFRISVRKPELIKYEGRVNVAVFPLTQSPIKPENLLVRANDGREIVFQVQLGPTLGQLLIEHTENTFLPISTFTQTDVNNGKVFYQHLKAFHGQTDNDFFALTANSKYTEPLHNITVDISISVRGAALGGLQRYITVQPLVLKEGSQVAITNRNVNLSAISDFISVHQKGNMWRSGMPTLKLVLSEMPKHGWLVNNADGYRLQYNDKVSLQLLSRQSIKYFHDDSETTEDDIGLAIWLWTNETTTSTWLLNITLPITIIPINDLPFQVTVPKGNVAAVVQEHWRKLNRNDLLTSDPDTPPAHILYEVLKLSHGRLILLSNSTLNPSLSPLSLLSGTTSTYSLKDLEKLKELPSISRFTQADIDAEQVIFYHSGPVSPVLISLRVSDGQFPPSPLTLTIPVQALTLQASQSQANHLRIQQGNSVMTLSVMNLPATTNGHLIHLLYNVTRLPLHGKLFLKDGSANSILPSTFYSASQHGKATVTFNHYELVRGELAYVQTDLSVANDSFEVGAYFNLDLTDENSHRQVSTSWLVNVVSVPLLKRVKEVRSFIKGYAVGGIIAPDEAEFSANIASIHTTMNLAVLDASPLAAVTGANPFYEILLPPKFGFIFKIPSQLYQNSLGYKNMKEDKGRYKRAYITQNSVGRVTARFSHEDVRRGSIIYSPSSDMISNDILPIRLTPNSRSPLFSSSMADEFIFKVLAPGVQPALGVAKFNIRLHDGTRYYDDKTHNQIISDGSTDPASKNLPNGESSLRELILSSKESLIAFGVIIIAVVTLSMFIIVGIRCTCSKERNDSRHCHATNNQLTSARDPKCNGGIGIIDAYTPSTTCTHLDQSCQSDSECSSHLPHNTSNHGTVLRPLLVSNLSPRVRHKVGNNSRTASDSGSWTSSGMRNEIPTPSVPQCRVTPLCNPICDGSSAGSASIGGVNSMVMCPLLSPAPLCDTFSSLPEEMPEQYGFTYGSLTNSLPQPEMRDQHTETVPFSELQYPTNPTSAGTLRRSNIQQNQYWV